MTLYIICGCSCSVMAELCHCNRRLQIWKCLLSHPLRGKLAASCCNVYCLIRCLERVCEVTGPPVTWGSLFGYQIAWGLGCAGSLPWASASSSVPRRRWPLTPLACRILWLPSPREKKAPNGNILWGRRDGLRNLSYLFDFLFLSRAFSLTKILVLPPYIKYRDAFQKYKQMGSQIIPFVICQHLCLPV